MDACICSWFGILMKHELKSPVTGSVWIHSVGAGQRVFEGNTVLVLESMKLEIPVESPVDGMVLFLAPAGTVIEEGSVVAIVED